jgi:hypothetical protein
LHALIGMDRTADWQQLKSAHLLSFVQSASNRVRSPSSTARGHCSSFSLDTAFGFDAVTFEA